MKAIQFWTLLFITFWISACKLDPEKLSNAKTEEVSNAADQDSLLNVSGNASIAFKESEFDFGMAVAGDTIRHAYEFNNNGTDTLMIYNVKTSCDCLFASSETEIVLPGQTSTIKIQYNTSDKIGPQDREIYITCNTFPAETKLKLKGYIKN